MYRKKIRLEQDYQLSYAEHGDRNGYPILIQHGLIASIDDYDLFDQLIQSNARLITAARPGYGESSPYLLESFAHWGNLLESLIEELNLDQFDVLGMSSGAPYSYAVGYRFAGKVNNIFIYSGMPALYDEIVLSCWPYELPESQSMEALTALAHKLFFSNVTSDDRNRNDIRDSMMHNGFGVAQDLRLRHMDWGFRLSDVKAKVFMRHSKSDAAVPFAAAVRTSELLPNCTLELTETAAHFSKEGLDDFITNTMIPNLGLCGRLCS
jgi:pimeloyl-ACP methyl ester carboxylesterase